MWDGQNLLAERDGAGARQAQYTDFPGIWGGLASVRRGSVSRYYGFDLSANTRALFDASQAASDSYLYRAFGVEQSVSGTSVNPLRFGGQVGYSRDEAERIYAWLQYFEPSTGRWLTTFLNGEPHHYRYADGNPVAWLLLASDGRKDWLCASWIALCLASAGLASPACFMARRCLGMTEIRPVYGKYCGPQDTPGIGEGDDTLDECCREHDEGWARECPPCTFGNQFKREECKEHTRRLCECFEDPNTCAEHEAWWRQNYCLFMKNSMHWLYCRWPFI